MGCRNIQNAVQEWRPLRSRSLSPQPLLTTYNLTSLVVLFSWAWNVSNYALHKSLSFPEYFRHLKLHKSFSGVDVAIQYKVAHTTASFQGLVVVWEIKYHLFCIISVLDANGQLYNVLNVLICGLARHASHCR